MPYSPFAIFITTGPKTDAGGNLFQYTERRYPPRRISKGAANLS
jgi:hypothetical protein